MQGFREGDGFIPMLPDSPKLPGIGMQREFWWIVAKYGNKLVIIGPETSEDAAFQLGQAKLDCPFEAVKLPTKDRGRATAMLKAREWKSTGNLDNALQRAKHQA